MGTRSGGATIGVKISRRTACGLIAGAAAVSVPGLDACAHAAGLSPARADIRYVLADRRHPESLRFAAMLTRHGAIALEVTDGMTSLWREALVPLWREEGGAVAGLTRRETWVCVAEQARSHGRKSVLAGRHALSAGGGVTEHYLTGAPSTLANAAMLETCGQAWPLVMADLAVRCPEGDRRAAANGRFAGPAGATGAVPFAFLASWVIA